MVGLVLAVSLLGGDGELVGGKISLPQAMDWEIGSLALPIITAETDAPKVGWHVYGIAEPPDIKIPHQIVSDTKQLILLVAKPGKYVIVAWAGTDPSDKAICEITVTGSVIGSALDTIGTQMYQALEASDSVSRVADATTIAYVYGYIAENVQRDGERKVPRYTTVVAVSNLLRISTQETLEGTSFPSIKERYPQVSGYANVQFEQIFGRGPGDDPDGGQLTGQKRIVFVELLKSLSRGALKFSASGG